MPQIAVTSPSFSNHPILQTEILEYFPGTKLNSGSQKFDREGLIDFLQGMDGAIVGLDPIDHTVLDKLPNLKIISKYGVGLDNINQDALKKRNIRLGWTPGVNRVSVAEQALAFMIGLSRNIFCSSFELKDNIWNKNGGRQLTGSKIGVIGLGNVGQELVRLIKPFNCEIYANDIADRDDFAHSNGIVLESKEYIASNCDVVTIHIPKYKQTQNLINTEFLQLMKPHSFLINTARGGIVDEEALYKCLAEGRIAGAAMDVFAIEPDVTNRLHSLNCFIGTPHIGGNAQEAVVAMGQSAIQHLKEYFL